MVMFSEMYLEYAQLEGLCDIFMCEFQNCGKFLEKPYVLACGHFICIDHIKPKSTSFKCNHCNKRNQLPNKSIIHLKISTIIDLLFNFNNNEEGRKKINEDWIIEKQSENFSNPKKTKMKTISSIRSNLNKRINRLFKRKQVSNKDNNTNDSNDLNSILEQYSSDESYNQLESTIKSSITKPDTKQSRIVNYKPFNYLEGNESETIPNLNLDLNTSCSKIRSINLLKFIKSKPSDDDSYSNLSVYQSNVSYEEGRYVGEFVNGQRNGYGVLYYNCGNKYEGHWLNDKRYGHGTFYFKKEQCKYIGDWQDDQRHGKGFLIERTRSKLQIWQNGKLIRTRI